MGQRGKSPAVKSRNRYPSLASDNPEQPILVPEPLFPLDSDARRWWDCLIPKLIEADIVGAIDLTLLALLCSTLGEQDRIEATLRTTGLTTLATNKAGMTNEIQHPLVKLRNTNRVAAVQMLKSLGMSPATRGVGKHPVPGFGEPKDDEETQIAKILGFPAKDAQ